MARDTDSNGRAPLGPVSTTNIRRDKSASNILISFYAVALTVVVDFGGPVQWIQIFSKEMYSLRLRQGHFEHFLEMVSWPPNNYLTYLGTYHLNLPRDPESQVMHRLPWHTSVIIPVSTTTCVS
jgi:hypothetical protein